MLDHDVPTALAMARSGRIPGWASSLLERIGTRGTLRLTSVASPEELARLAAWLRGWPREAKALGVCSVCGRRTVGKLYCSMGCNRRFLMLRDDLEFASGVRERPEYRKKPHYDADWSAMESQHPPGAARFLRPPKWFAAQAHSPCVVVGSGALLRRHGVATDAPSKHLVVATRVALAVVSARRLVVPHPAVERDILMAVGWSPRWRMPEDVAEAFEALSNR